MSQVIQNNHRPSSVGANAPQENSNQPLSGDSALSKALLLQVEELGCLSDAATSESAMSVALRKTMQNAVNKNIEELQQLLSFCSTCEGGSNWNKLANFVKGNDHSFSALLKAFPHAGLSGVPDDKRQDFVNRLINLVPDAKHVSMFRTEVGTLGTTLQQYGTYQTAAKNLADTYQNGAGSMSQSMSQDLAQLASIGGLMGDQLVQ